MKKLIMTIAIVLSMGSITFAQCFSETAQKEKGLFGKGSGISRDSGLELLSFPGYGLETDQDGDPNSVPLGSGIAMLMGLGAAYMVAKKHEEE